MKSYALAFAFAASSAALVARDQPCCFTLYGDSKATSGTVGQLQDGQNRVGGHLPAAKFCMDSNGAITDSLMPQPRGCALDSPNSQFQCDSGHSAQAGFSINSQSHQLEYNGQSTFWECPTGEDGEENLFNIAMNGNSQCQSLTLTADACYGFPKQPSSSSVTSSSATSSPASSSSASSSSASSSSASSSSASSSPTSTRPASSTSAIPSPTTSTTPSPSQTTPTGCPKDLPPNAYQTPHLIVPVDSANAQTTFGTTFFGQINDTFSSLFNFDVPSSYSGKKCSLIFTFPEQDQLETSSFTFSGSGDVDICELSAIPSLTTNYGNKPDCGTDFGSKTLQPGTAVDISTFDCPAGKTVGYQLQLAEGSSVALNYFQDWNPCPIGLFMTVEG